MEVQQPLNPAVNRLVICDSEYKNNMKSGIHYLLSTAGLRLLVKHKHVVFATDQSVTTDAGCQPMVEYISMSG